MLKLLFNCVLLIQRN